MPPGGVAERSNAPVLKTGVRSHRTAGSNPAPSAAWPGARAAAAQVFCWYVWTTRREPFLHVTRASISVAMLLRFSVHL
ncbi:MAG: hypothetical protein QOE11_1164 [Solirubrobacteraceae bacterium]|nr:hypothetical protein [Solirubrobacteraceae bacterium]